MNRIIGILILIILIPGSILSQRRVETDTLKARKAFKLQEGSTWRDRTSFFARLDASNYVTSTAILDGTITFEDIANNTITLPKLAFSVSGDGLYLDEFNTLHVAGDGATIGIVSDQLRLLANSVDSSKVKNRSLDTLDLRWNYFNLTPGPGLIGQERIRLGTSNIWEINPDNNTITISGDAVAVRQGGIYSEHLNAIVAGAGLGKPNLESPLQVNVGAGLYIQNDTLKANIAGIVEPGLGLSQSGNALNVNTKQAIVIMADTVQLNPSIAGVGLHYDGGVLNTKTAHGIQISADTIRINPAIAGSALKWKGDSLNVNVTGKSLVVANDTLKINSDIAGNGLGFSSEVLSIKTGRGLRVVNDTLKTKQVFYIPFGFFDPVIDCSGTTMDLGTSIGRGFIIPDTLRLVGIAASFDVNYTAPSDSVHYSIDSGDNTLHTFSFSDLNDGYVKLYQSADVIIPSGITEIRVDFDLSCENCTLVGCPTVTLKFEQYP